MHLSWVFSGDRLLARQEQTVLLVLLPTSALRVRLEGRLPRSGHVLGDSRLDLRGTCATPASAGVRFDELLGLH